MKEEDKTKILKSFKMLKDEPSPKKKQPYRIRIEGLFARVGSGKQIWFGIGAAKNAVRNHLEVLFHLDDTYAYDYKKALIEEFMQEHVEYVPVTV